MTTVFNINVETGDFTEFTGNTGTNITVASGAALNGSYGVSVLVNSATQYRCYEDAAQSVTFRERYYIDPNTITMASGDQFVHAQIHQNGGSGLNIIQVALKYVTGVGYSIAISTFNDANTDAGNSDTAITDAPHYVEIKIVRAATSVSSDGTYDLWIDGVSKLSATGIDNFNLMSDQTWRVSWGMISDRDAGTTGTIYLDSFKGNDDGGAIGAYIDEPIWIGSGAQTVTATPSTTLTPALPTTLIAGDLMVMILAGRSNGSTITNTISNSWTLLGSQFFEVTTGLNDLWIGVYVRVAQSGEAAPTVTPDSDFLVAGAATGGLSAQIAAFRNITSDLDVAVQTNSNAAAATWTPPSVTTATNKSLVISCVATADDNALNFNTANYFTLIMSGANYDTTTGSDHAVGMAFFVDDAAGAITMPIWNESAVGNDAWVGVTCAFGPPARKTYLMQVNQSVKRASFI